MGPVRTFQGWGWALHPSTARGSFLQPVLHMSQNDWSPTLVCSVRGGVGDATRWLRSSVLWPNRLSIF
jgi:hypothetical protein